MKIEMGKKYTTRDGRPVRILCVDGPEPYPVVALTQDGAVIRHSAEGQCSYGEDERSNLIEAKPEPVVEVQWGYVARDEGYRFVLRNSREHAEDCLKLPAFMGCRLAKRTITTEIL